MGNLRSIDGPHKDRRREPRTDIDLGLTVWGVDTRGDRFLQEARAREVSLSGGLLTGLDAELRSGDVIGILYRGKKARYRVVWVHLSGRSDKIQAPVHRFPPMTAPGRNCSPNRPRTPRQQRARQFPTLSIDSPCPLCPPWLRACSPKPPTRSWRSRTREFPPLPTRAHVQTASLRQTESVDLTPPSC